MTQDYHKNYLADWLAGKISDDELKQLVSETDFQEYLKIREASDLMGYFEQTDESLPERIRAKYPKIGVKKSQQKRLKYWLGMAAMFLLLFGIFRVLNYHDTVMINAGIGESRTVALLDGSEVILNANSYLSYSKKQWQEGQRQVYLTGEAFFKVQKGSDFVVKTAAGQVKVLGTQFDVKDRLDLFQVICYTGKVWVKSDKIDTVLTPGKAVRQLDIDGLVQHWELRQSQPAWLSGESSYQNTALKYVLKDLENQYDISFDSSRIDDTVKFTGSFPHHNLKKALASVFKTLGIKYIVKNRQVILSK